MNSPQTLTLQIDAAVGVLTLQRPDKLNCLTEQMHQELRAAFDALEQALQTQALRALVITGAGRAFCAGQDLSERQSGPDQPALDVGGSLRRNYNPLVARIAALPVPVIAAVNGVAAGSGASLALACDLVLAARSATFIASFGRIGLIPDAGATWVLPRLIGMARAKALTFLGEPVSAEQARQWGLIWQVVDDAQLMPTALTLARRLAGHATRGLALQKRAYAATLQNDLAAQLELEAQLQAEACRTSDYREGVASFLERREPGFIGR